MGNRDTPVHTQRDRGVRTEEGEQAGDSGLRAEGHLLAIPTAVHTGAPWSHSHGAEGTEAGTRPGGLGVPVRRLGQESRGAPAGGGGTDPPTLTPLPTAPPGFKKHLWLLELRGGGL